MIDLNLQCSVGSDALKIKSFTRFIYVKLLCHNFLKACNKIDYLKLFISFYSVLIQFKFLLGYIFVSV